MKNETFSCRLTNRQSMSKYSKKVEVDETREIHRHLT